MPRCFATSLCNIRTKTRLKITDQCKVGTSAALKDYQVNDRTAGCADTEGPMDQQEPRHRWHVLAVMVVLYLGAVEVAKQWFYRRMTQP